MRMMAKERLVRNAQGTRAPKGMHLLDSGCGTGRALRFVAAEAKA